MIKARRSNRVPSALIVPVLTVNLLCAFQFLVNPQDYQATFDLSGEPGRIAIQSVGILFLMWNVPYIFAVCDPDRFRTALACAILMQAVGILGETALYTTISPHLNSRVAVFRFIIFDTGGFILLLGAYLYSVFRNKE